MIDVDDAGSIGVKPLLKYYMLLWPVVKNKLMIIVLPYDPVMEEL